MIHLGLSLILLASVAHESGAPADPVHAVVTGAGQQVTAEGPDGSVLPVRDGQILPSGWSLTVPDASSLRLVCSNDHRVVVEGPRRTMLSTALCTAGRRLAPETYRALVPGNRSLAPVLSTTSITESSTAIRQQILRIRTRGDEEDDPRTPVLLHPRETAVLSARPTLRWTEVPDAREYVLELVGHAPWNVRLDATEVECTSVPDPPETRRVCSLPWPPDAPDLAPGESSFLRIGATHGVARVLFEGTSHPVRLLSGARSERILESLAVLEEVDDRSHDTALRKALFLIEHDLLGAAEETLREALVDEIVAPVLLLQGSLYLKRHLPRAAYRRFREAACRARDLDLASEALRGARAARQLSNEPGR